MRFSCRFCLIIIGFIISLLIIEILLQAMSFAAFAFQRQGYLSENKKYENHYRILAIGESTTADLYNGESSWPAELEKILNNKSQGKIKFKVFNEGVPGTTSQIILSKLSSNLDKYRPNMVITMLGYNDPSDSRVYYEESGWKFLKIPKFLRWIKLNFMHKKDQNAEPCQIFFDEEYEIALSNVQMLINSNNLEAAAILLEKIEKSYSYCFSHCRIGYSYNRIGNRIGTIERKYYLDKALKHIELGKETDSDCKIQLIYLYLMKSENNTYYYDAVRLVEELLINNHSLIDEQEGQIFGSFIDALGGEKINTSILPNFFYFYGYDYLKYSKDNKIPNITAVNYNLIDKKIKSKGINHVVMQYPRQDIDFLKKYFAKPDEIVFISNQLNFERALDYYSRDEVFIDTMGYNNKSKFGGKPFGHATLLGNRLIAENAAGVILKELNITS